MKTTKSLIILIFLLLIGGNLFSQEKEKKEKSESEDRRRNAINICPGGLALGIVSVNYERLITQKHGLVFRVDYEAIPKTYSEANINPYGMAFILNYRYHLKGGMNSCFVGIYSRYREYRGTGNLNDTEFNFKKTDLTLGLNVGRRWTWKSGFNVTAAFGYGFSIETQKVQTDSQEIQQAIDVFEDEYDFVSPFYGEISIGYAF